MDSLVPCLVLAIGCALPVGDRSRRWLVAAACAAALVLFAARFAIVPEDTFISMRYARHLADGQGLVYNTGERVEGYTNFLWTVLLAGVHVGGAPPLETAVGLSIAFGAATAVLLAVTAPRLLGGGATMSAAAAALVLLPTFWDAAGAGLETAMYVFLVTAAVVAQALALREGRAPGLALAVPLALAVLTRPEGIYVAGLLCVAGGLAFRTDRALVRRHATILAAAAAVFVAHLLWRRAYYGDWLPNTFYCKVGATSTQVRRGVEQFLQFLRTGNGLLLVPYVVAPWFVRRAPWILPPLLLAAGYTAYVIAIGGDNFWRHRYLVPIVPALLLISEFVVRQTAGASIASLPRLARSALAAAAVVALWGSVDGIKLNARKVSLAEQFAPLRRVGEWLTANTPEGRSVAVFAAGVVPYYTQRPVIDMLGLCDHHIARVKPPEAMGLRNAGHEKYDFRYVLARDPEIVLIQFPDDANPNSLLTPAMKADPGLRAAWFERYEPIEIVVEGGKLPAMRRRR